MTNNCIIIPTYNEERNIGSVIENIRKYSDADIIVIDDGSNDLTSAVARKSKAFVIRHPFNMGYGVALQTGYKYALENNYDVLLQIDGDGQHNPEHIPELINQIKNSNCDLVIGSRFFAQSDYKAGFLKSLGVKLFGYIIWVITDKIITDPTSGYQCLNKKVFELFSRDTFPYDYPDANVIVMLHRSGLNVMEIPVEMIPNPDGRSMHRGIFKILYYIFKMFLSIFVTMIRKH